MAEAESFELSVFTAVLVKMSLHYYRQSVGIQNGVSLLAQVLHLKIPAV